MNEGNGGSPFRADYTDSKVHMYKDLKVQQDLDIGEILAKDTEVDLAGAAEKENKKNVNERGASTKTRKFTLTKKKTTKEKDL